MPNEGSSAAGPKGLIFDIKRFALHDGPGIRTSVFLKGCPLSCTWCHNPESISAEPQISFVAERCISCGRCVEACRSGARRLEQDHLAYDRSKCTACGECAPVCPTTATEVVGQWQSLDELWPQLAADRPFYQRSGGGVTISGGEPLAQFDFARALVERARSEDIHVCLDTCGYAPGEQLREISSLVDLFLYDIKETDPARHQEHTGVSNEQIMANLRLCDALGRPIILRCPIIPGINLRPGYLDELAHLYHSLSNCLAVHLMPYHTLTQAKYARLGITLPQRWGREPEPEEVESWYEQLAALGVNAERP